MPSYRLSAFERAREAVPKPVKVALRPLLGLVADKYSSEMGWWRNRHRIDGFQAPERYKLIMLAMAGERDTAFLTNKVVADFGCGPQGSLAWLEAASARIGIDVLASRYAEAFPDDIRSHGMVYVTSTEETIPMPDASVDVMFTMNALDHCANLEAMCAEIVRVIRPAGELIGAFHLNEPATYAEPQTLTEEKLDRLLLRDFKEGHRHIGISNDALLRGEYSDLADRTGTMWFRGTKP